jgi:hypothetical protein
LILPPDLPELDGFHGHGILSLDFAFRLTAQAAPVNGTKRHGQWLMPGGG